MDCGDSTIVSCPTSCLSPTMTLCLFVWLCLYLTHYLISIPLLLLLRFKFKSHMNDDKLNVSS